VQELAADPRGAPAVLDGHPTNELANFGREGRAAGTTAPPGEKGPVEAEARAMPADHGVGLDDGERALPPGPEPAKYDPEDPIRGSDQGSLPGGEGGELLAERQVLEDEILRQRPDSSTVTSRTNYGERQPDQRESHEWLDYARRAAAFAFGAAGDRQLERTRLKHDRWRQHESLPPSQVDLRTVGTPPDHAPEGPDI